VVTARPGPAGRGGPTGPAGADPGSLSHLGGVLRTAAATLATDLVGLNPGTPTAQLCATTVDRLDTVGVALQTHAQDLSIAAAAVARLADQVHAAGLTLSGWSVEEPYGLVSAERAEGRRAARPDLQAQADRLAASLARSRAQLDRLLGRADSDLDEAVRAVRAPD